jgi:Arc/MetJ-type ribon-helix-helix transcriptional regulator
MASPPRSTRTFTVSFPPELAEQVELTARAENRTTSELFREAFRTYQAQRARKILRESQTAFRGNNPSGYTAADVQRLVKEYRAEKRAKKK